MEIVLKFNDSNCKSKYGEEYQEEEIIKTTRWVIGCAMAAISEHYKEGSVRRREMENLYDNLMEQVKSQLTAEQIEILET